MYLGHTAGEGCMSVCPFVCLYVSLHVSLGAQVSSGCVSGHLSIPLDFCIFPGGCCVLISVPACVCVSLCVSMYTTGRTFLLAVLVSVRVSEHAGLSI